MSGSLTHWLQALTSMKNGASNAKILCIGDSTTFGTGANGTSSGNWQPTTYPTQLSGKFTSAGINSHANAWMGGGRNTADQWPRDARITDGSSWTADTSFDTRCFGGYTAKATTNTNAFSFLPTVNVDTFIVYYLQVTSGPRSFNLDINGGAATTVNVVNAANQLATQNITATLGSNTCNATWVSGATGTYVAGMEAYNSNKKWVSVINAGYRGSNTGDWCDATSPFSAGKAATYATVAPDLTIISMAINDWVDGTSLATYQTNLQTLINLAMGVGSVLLVTSNPSDPSLGVSLATQATYTNVELALAASNNIPIVDIFNQWGSYAASNANGWNFDGLHPNGTGYGVIAQQIFNAITSQQVISGVSVQQEGLTILDHGLVEDEYNNF